MPPLEPGSQNPQRPDVGPGQVLDGDRGCGSGSEPGHPGPVHQSQRLSRVGIEQRDLGEDVGQVPLGVLFPALSQLHGQDVQVREHAGHAGADPARDLEDEFAGEDVVPLLMIGEGLLHHVDGLLDAES